MASGRAEAGLLIHEGQLTFGARPLKVLDLGEWWLLETGLPLPLGVNVARRDVERLGDAVGRPRATRSDWGSTTARRRLNTRCGSAAASTRDADRFVEMYVNELTTDYGDLGRTAVDELLRRGEAIGAPGPVSVDWIA